MRAGWNLPNAELATKAWTELEVLLEFNGPQLVKVRSDDRDYLSVASDEDDACVRWLRAEVSKVEYDALLRGATTVRECLLKPTVWVVDADADGLPLRQWRTPSGALHEEDLPSPLSLLPEDVIAAHRIPVELPVFAIDGPGIAGATLGFRPLADLTQTLQRLWDALGQALVGQATAKGRVSSAIAAATEIRLGAVVPGSVGLQVEAADPATFGRVAAEYRRLLLAVGDPCRFRELLLGYKSRVRAALADYLDAVDRHDVEVLAIWSDGAAYVSSATARRTAATMRFAGGEEEERFRTVGYFVGFSLREARFDLIEGEDGERYEGTVAPQLLSSLDCEIVLGPAASYDVGLSVTTFKATGAAAKQAYVLVSLAPAAVASVSMNGPNTTGR